jgi:Tol biopolymer transport system component
VKLAAIAAIAVGFLVAVAFAGAAPGGRIVFAADHAPLWNGHIYVVRPGGAPVDLSVATPGLDTGPALSPDGKRIAFVSTRSGLPAIYTASVDGSAVTRVSPDLPAGASATIAWAPSGESLAVVYVPQNIGHGTLATAQLNGGWRVLPGEADSLIGFTPDGRYVTVYDQADEGTMRTEDLTGKVRMSVHIVSNSGSWSVGGRLLVLGSTVRNTPATKVYDESGRLLASYAGVEIAAWSPDGRLLATVTDGGTLQFRTGGVGRPLRSIRAGRSNGLVWVNADAVRVDLQSGSFVGVSAATGARTPVPRAEADTLAYGPAGSSAGFVGDKLVLAQGGTRRTLETLPPDCQDAVQGMQFGSDGTLVYASSCLFPSNEIYSMAPDGSSVRQLTNTLEDESEPALSPDGSRIAYVQLGNNSDCHGCPRTVWLMNADGTGAHALPNSPDENVPYDFDPTFSPDGKTLIFVREGSESESLSTRPVAGGAVHTLRFDGYHPAWGPHQVASVSERGVTVSNPDGSSAQLVAKAQRAVPAWSADGRLAVLEPGASSLTIVIPLTGKRITIPGLIAPETGENGQTVGLTWSPDGSTFAFTAATPADPVGGDVYEIGVDGSHLTQVTHGAGAEGPIGWRA